MLENPNAVTISTLFAKDTEVNKQTRIEKVDYQIDEVVKICRHYEVVS